MKCPRTNVEMEEVEIDGVKVNISPGCGGVWFDNFELRKFDEIHEDAGDELIALMEKYHKEINGPDEKLPSPAQPDVIMMRRFYSPAREIEIDICPATNGVWLDSDELCKIRSLYPTKEDRQAASEKFVGETLAPVFEELADGHEEELSQSRLRNLFKFILPSK